MKNESFSLGGITGYQDYKWSWVFLYLSFYFCCRSPLPLKVRCSDKVQWWLGISLRDTMLTSSEWCFLMPAILNKIWTISYKLSASMGKSSSLNKLENLSLRVTMMCGYLSWVIPIVHNIYKLFDEIDGIRCKSIHPNVWDFHTLVCDAK